jgi:cathepsin L
MLRFVLVLMMALGALGLPHAEALDSWTFETYAAHFRPNLQRNTPEWQLRQRLFEQRLALAKEHNANPTATWKMGINKFSDWTSEERNVFIGYIPHANRDVRGTSFAGPIGVVPDHVDWRTKHVLTAIKNQGMCGSCWAHAATEAMESSAAVSSGKDPLVLSVEQVTQCTPNPNHCGGSGKCGGATAELGYEYVANQTGITLDSKYPYTASSGQCKFPNPSMPPVVKVSGFTQFKENSRDETFNAAANFGPPSVAVAVSWGDGLDWWAYSSGVHDGCNKQKTLVLNHAVQLVAYDLETDGSYTWVLRNSWGASWGEQGYIRLADTSNCVIDPDPSQGSGCRGGPPNVTVCGPCGLFYEVSWPKATLI